MADRSLPTRRNPHLDDIGDDSYRRDLVNKRRLGQTQLAVNPGQVGTSNATKPKNLGGFDYAHLKCPLPKDLKGSGIFHSSRGHGTPDSYFLMRRSSDGFISGSGMFKIAFPWASEAEEAAEKAYIKSLPGTGKEEIAGNLWIPPQSALELGNDYALREWVLALLDPAEMSANTGDEHKNIKAPPVFDAAAALSSPARSTRSKTPTLRNGINIPPPSSPKDMSPRKRALRSASPSKIPALTEDVANKARKIATPKRTKRTGRGASASVEPEEDTIATTVTAAKRKVSGKIAELTQTIPEEVEETKPTRKSRLQTPPASQEHPTIELPKQAQTLLDSAKKTINEAKSLKDSHAASVRGRKRKATDFEQDDEEADPAEAGSSAAEKDNLPVTKKQRLGDIEVRKDRVKRRAAVGIAAGLAIGTFAPIAIGYVFGF